MKKLLLVSLIGILSARALGLNVDLSHITVTPLKISDEKWFITELNRSFMAVYKDKTFAITTEDGGLALLAKTNTRDKSEWLTQIASEEFQEYVISPKEGYHAVALQYQGYHIGALFYRLLEDGKTNYLAQFFILPEFQKKGIGLHFLVNIVPKMHPEYTRSEILARHQNDAAFLLYIRAGYSIGTPEMVTKYDYDPLRYLPFYREHKVVSGKRSLGIRIPVDPHK